MAQTQQSFRCGALKADGTLCRFRTAIAGVRCYHHGGPAGPRQSPRESTATHRERVRNDLPLLPDPVLTEFGEYTQALHVLEKQATASQAFAQFAALLALRGFRHAQHTDALSDLKQASGLLKEALQAEKLQHQVEQAKQEAMRLRRQNALVQTGATDLLSQFRHLDKMLESGFVGEDTSPRSSLDRFLAFLGETQTVEDVLAGRCEQATAPWSMQRQILEALFWPAQLGRPLTKTVCVVTGNGTGKSHVAARAALFQAVCRFPSKTVVVGPRLSQTQSTIGNAVKTLHAHLGLPGECHTKIWRPSEDTPSAYVSITSAQTDEGLAGQHGRLLIICEEASGIPAHIWQAINGLKAGHDVKVLMIGNPLRRAGHFYRTFAETPPDDPHTLVLQLSAYDHPNWVHRDFIRARGNKPIIPYALSADWVEESLKLWGPDSWETQVRIHGLPPKHDVSVAIPLHLVEAAQNYEPPEEFPVHYEVIGADVAGFGDDNSVIVRWQVGPQGHRIHIHAALASNDHTLLCNEMLHAATQPIASPDLYFTCDTVGEGSGVLEMLRDRGALEYNLAGYKGHATPDGERINQDEPEYETLECEAWCHLNTLLTRHLTSLQDTTHGQPHLRMSLPDDEKGKRLTRELSERGIATKGRVIALQPKKEYRKLLGGTSPDYADSLALTARMVRRVHTQRMRQGQPVPGPG